MEPTLKDWIYYLLKFDFIIKNTDVYKRLRDILYEKHEFDEITISKYIKNHQPLTCKEVVLNYKEYVREKKLNLILED